MKLPEQLDQDPEDRVPSPEESSFGAILSQFEQEHRSGKADQAIPGTIIAVNGGRAFVDIGRKIEGVMRAEPGMAPGISVLVLPRGRNEEGYYELSTLRIEQPKDWSSLQAAFSEGRTIAGTVIEAVKGGLRVDVGMRAFMPASRSGARDQAEIDKLVGQEIQCRITKLDTASEDVVVDRRAVLEELEKISREEAFLGLQEGMVLPGTVRSVTAFGAFVDIGGVDGLLHVTDMSWTRVAKPSDVVAPGQQLELKILKIDAAARKISLGLKQLLPDPWTVASQQFHIGDRVHGVVSRLTDFGAFVEILPGVDGLIHVSEMSWSKKVRKPADLLNVGESVEVVILGMTPPERRIALGLKQALGDPWEDAEAKFAAGAVVEGAVTTIANFGVFVDLGAGIEGMIHVGDITRERRLDHPRELLKAGQVVRAAVVELDRDRRRIRLSMKQLEPTSADQYIAGHQPGELVTGRVVEAKGDRLKVELGEGVFAVCALAREETAAASVDAAPKLDLSQLTAKLAARWRQGGGSNGETKREREVLRPGQMHSFRIVSLDPGQKKIQVELAGG